MIIDRRLQVSALQALTATGASTDVIDLGVKRPIGPGEPMWLIVSARTGLGGTTPTLDIKVQGATDAAFTSPIDLAVHPQLNAAAFATGKQVIIQMPYTNERFLRLLYTLGGTSPTATIDAFLTNQDPTTWVAFPDAI